MRRNIKFLSFSVISIIVILFLSQNFSILSYAQTGSQATSQTGESLQRTNELWNGIIIAIISAILGFLANVFVEGIKRKTQLIKQISFTKSIKGGIVGSIEKDIENKVSILYDDKPAKNLSYVLFDIENTGNSQVKNQEIRFEFTEDSEIIDLFLENERDEMEVERNVAPNLGKNQRKCKIGRLQPKDKLGFRFIVKSPENKSLTLEHYTKNDEDVSFIATESKKASDDIDQIKYFLKFSFVIFVIFPLIKNIILENVFIDNFFRELINIFVSLIALILSAYLIIRIGDFIEAIVNLLSNSSRKSPGIQAEKIAVLALEGSQVSVDNFTMVAEDKTNQGA